MSEVWKTVRLAIVAIVLANAPWFMGAKELDSEWAKGKQSGAALVIGLGILQALEKKLGG